LAPGRAHRDLRAAADNADGLLVVEIDDLLLDATGGCLRPPRLVLADEEMSVRASSAAPLPSGFGLHHRETARKLKGAPLGLVGVGDEVL
jgi:hypothetical protein